MGFVPSASAKEGAKDWTLSLSGPSHQPPLDSMAKHGGLLARSHSNANLSPTTKLHKPLQLHKSKQVSLTFEAGMCSVDSGSLVCLEHTASEMQRCLFSAFINARLLFLLTCCCQTDRGCALDSAASLPLSNPH